MNIKTAKLLISVTIRNNENVWHNETDNAKITLVNKMIEIVLISKSRFRMIGLASQAIDELPS